MDLGEGLGLMIVVGALLFAPAPASAGDVAQGDFSVSWEKSLLGGRDAAIKGYVDNRSQLRVGEVHLRVETLDTSGRVIGESFGWVMGDVLPRGRGYFVIRVTVPGAAYRVTVESYDAISASPGSGGLPAAPPAESPLMAP
jgi:hypothetical protein